MIELGFSLPTSLAVWPAESEVSEASEVTVFGGLEPPVFTVWRWSSDLTFERKVIFVICKKCGEPIWGPISDHNS
jgi:hypothetical protein